MKRFLLDVKADPVLFEKNNSNNTWLIVVAVVALLAIVGFFIWKRRGKK
ncbi:MAG: LPXTG cell wall anchor domain-containing protein [Chitinophagaceae bacterium]